MEEHKCRKFVGKRIGAIGSGHAPSATVASILRETTELFPVAPKMVYEHIKWYEEEGSIKIENGRIKRVR